MAAVRGENLKTYRKVSFCLTSLHCHIRRPTSVRAS